MICLSCAVEPNWTIMAIGLAPLVLLIVGCLAVVIFQGIRGRILAARGLKDTCRYCGCLYNIADRQTYCDCQDTELKYIEILMEDEETELIGARMRLRDKGK